MLAENIGFSVWQMFSIATAVLASIGYGFTSDQLFWLVATAGLVGAIMRVPYTFMPALGTVPSRPVPAVGDPSGLGRPVPGCRRGAAPTKIIA